MSACGCPEPSTGIRLPRGQCEHCWSRRVSAFSSRIARSRYFSWISLSVVGFAVIACAAYFDEPPRPPAGASALAAPPPAAHGLGRPLRPSSLDGRRARGRLEELQGLHVDEVLAAADDVGVA